MKDDLLLIDTIREYPCLVVVKLNGLGKVDFNIGTWVRDPELKIVIPHPTTADVAMAYVAEYLLRIDVVPCTTGLRSAAYVKSAREHLLKFAELVKKAESPVVRHITEDLVASAELIITP